MRLKVALLIFLTGAAALAQGTCTNPIIHADYSDPDAIRVGDDFYMVSSSFGHVPGLPVLHSRDLVHWEIIGHAVQQLPSPLYDRPQHGKGIWAPSIRYHLGEFRIYYGDPDLGIYLAKSKNPAGPWEPPVLVKEAKGWIDPCPLWDDDGQAYLVHAWAKSRVGFNSILTVNRMSADGTRILDEGVTVFDGHDNHPTIEGPKFYKREGWYYIFAPAGGVKTGWQTVLRSRSVYGPYENKIVLKQGNTGVNGPHQGGWIELANGDSWFIHFQDRGAYGRITHLQPMRWQEGWPMMGVDLDGDGIGEPAHSFAAPALPLFPAIIPTSDEFDSSTPGLQWQWQANIDAAWYRLNAAAGFLRLQAIAPPDRFRNLWDLPNIIAQKFPAGKFEAVVKLSFNPLSPEERAGMIIFGSDYACLNLKAGQEGYKLQQSVCAAAEKGGGEKIIASIPIDRPDVFLKVSVGDSARCSFSFSTDGVAYSPAGTEFIAVPGKWVGAKVGLFAAGTAEKPAVLAGGCRQDSAGHADFDFIRFTFSDSTE